MSTGGVLANASWSDREERMQSTNHESRGTILNCCGGLGNQMSADTGYAMAMEVELRVHSLHTSLDGITPKLFHC